jgi:hypothetical protein
MAVGSEHMFDDVVDGKGQVVIALLQYVAQAPVFDQIRCSRAAAVHQALERL